MMATSTPPAGASESRADPRPDECVFRLYVSAGSPVSARAIVNARRFFERVLPGAHRLVVLNIAEHVESAKADQIIASPTLVRIAPLPRRSCIGDMSNTARLAMALGMTHLLEG